LIPGWIIVDEDEYISGLEGWFQGKVEPCDDNTSLIEISGTYCIDTSRLTEQQLLDLGKIFEQLPSLNVASDGTLCYFGSEEESSPILSVSFEPSGIVVWGKLTLDQWIEWDGEFRHRVDQAALPRFPG
jgi:hypothetical protein